MMYLQLGEERFDPERPELVLHRAGCDPKRIASLKVKRPNSGSGNTQANWTIFNGMSEKNGDVKSGWEDNDRFFKYLKKGDAGVRKFTIAEEGRSGWWKQYNYKNLAQTIIPTNIRFRLPDADQGA